MATQSEIDALLDKLVDPSFNVRLEGMHALVKLGWQPITQYQRALLAVANMNYESAVTEGEAAIDYWNWLVNCSPFEQYSPARCP